jgi:hypothetical protein
MSPVDVWVRMAEMYGERWTTLMGDVPNEMWVAGMGVLTDAQKQHGFQQLVEEGGEHPPALPKFMRMCKRSSPSYHRQVTLPSPAEVMTDVKRAANSKLMAAVFKHHTAGTGEHITKEKLTGEILPALNKMVKELEQLTDEESWSDVYDLLDSMFEQRVRPLL